MNFVPGTRVNVDSWFHGMSLEIENVNNTIKIRSYFGHTKFTKNCIHKRELGIELNETSDFQ